MPVIETQLPYPLFPTSTYLQCISGNIFVTHLAGIYLKRIDLLMSVLIIDDEIDLSLLLKSYFNRKGFDVRLAHSLGDGMQCIESFRPDFLFLDNNLPDGLGWQEAPGIAGKYPSIFQYLISAYHPAVPEMPGHARYKVLEKPISFSDLDNHFHTSTTSENETSPVES